MQQQNNKNLKTNFIILGGVILILLGITANPYLISKYFISPGHFWFSTKIKIIIIETLLISSGLFLLILLWIQSSKIPFVKKVEEKTYLFYIQNRFKIIFGIWLLLLIFIMVWRVPPIKWGWKKATGYEYLWIAESLAKGKGFSFESSHRWLFSSHGADSSPHVDEYYPTAWEEPVYPILLAAHLIAFGKYAKLAIVVFQTIALFCTSVLLFFIGRKTFDTQTGLLAGTILSIWPYSRRLAESSLGPHIFAGFVICLSAYLIFWCLDRLSVKRAIFLGSVLGFGCLTFSMTLLFIPIASVLVLLHGSSFSPVNRKAALAVLLGACFIVMPWSIRNLIAFGKFVPVKNGLGQITHVSNPILAATFSSDSYACNDSLGPLWKAQNAKEAIWLSSKDRKKRLQLNMRSRKCIEQKAPVGYEKLNEAERDKFYLKNAFEFIGSNPGLFLALAYQRVQHFFFGWNGMRAIVPLLALLGALSAIRNNRSGILILLVFAYTVPFYLATPYFYRYRYSIEPILILFAIYPFIFLASKFQVWLKSMGIQKTIRRGNI